MRIKVIILISFLAFISQVAYSDILTLKTNEIYEGSIIDVEEGEILFKADKNGEVFIGSFDKKDISKIELEPYEFPEKLTIFDILFFEKGTDLPGYIEIETPEAIYFSLYLRGGIGIVEIKRDRVLGINGVYGLARLASKVYFKSIYFMNDLKLLVNNAIKKEDSFSQDTETMYQWGKELEEEQLEGVVNGRKVYKPKSLKFFLGDVYALSKDKQYALGVEYKYLVIGMSKDQVKKVLGEPIKIANGTKKVQWVYNNGITCTFYNDKLVAYTRKNRKMIIRDTKLYFGDKIVTS